MADPLEAPRLYAGFRLLLRTALALPMIASGIVRLIPVQMPPLRPLDQLQRLGEFTQWELLRTTVGASPVFQSFTGLAALLGGVLLLFPGTTFLGAVICAANLSMAVTLALCYDLPFKPWVFTLFFLSFALLAPDLRRLVDLLLLGRAVDPSEEPPVPVRWAGGLLPLLGLGVLVVGAAVAVPRLLRLHPPEPPFYGAWNVEELLVDGEKSADPRRWRRVVFQDPGALDVQLAIGSRKRHALGLDLAGKTMMVGGARLSFQEPEEGVLVLEGRLNGRLTRAKLRRMLLSDPWFHWIADEGRYYE